MKSLIKQYIKFKDYLAFTGGTYAGIFISGKEAYVSVYINKKGSKSIHHKITLLNSNPSTLAVDFSRFLQDNKIKVDLIGLNIQAQYFPIRIPHIPLREIYDFLAQNSDLFLPPGVSSKDYLWRFIPYGKDNDELLLTVILISRKVVESYIQAFEANQNHISLLTVDLFDWPQDNDSVLMMRNDDESIFQFFKNGIPVYAIHFPADKIDHSLLSVSLRQFALESVGIQEIANPFDISDHFAHLAGPVNNQVLVNFLSQTEIFSSLTPVKKRQTSRLGLIVGMITLLLLLSVHVIDFFFAKKIMSLKTEIDNLTPIVAEIQSEEKRLESLMHTYSQFIQSQSQRPGLTNLLAILSNNVPDGLQFQNVSFKKQDQKIIIDVSGVARHPEHISHYLQLLESNLKGLQIQLRYTRYLAPTTVFRKWKKKSIGLYEFQIGITIHEFY